MLCFNFFFLIELLVAFRVCGDILGDIMNEMGTSDNDITNDYGGLY